MRWRRSVRKATVDGRFGSEVGKDFTHRATPFSDLALVTGVSVFALLIPAGFLAWGLFSDFVLAIVFLAGRYWPSSPQPFPALAEIYAPLATTAGIAVARCGRGEESHPSAVDRRLSMGSVAG